MIFILKWRRKVSIRKVADCGLHSRQVTQKFKRAATLEFTTEPANIFHIVNGRYCLTHELFQLYYYIDYTFEPLHHFLSFHNYIDHNN